MSLEVLSVPSVHVQKPLYQLPPHVLDFLRVEEENKQKILDAFWRRRGHGGAARYLCEPTGKIMND